MKMRYLNTRKKIAVGHLLLPFCCVLRIGCLNRLITQQKKRKKSHIANNIGNEKKARESNTIPLDCNFQCRTQMKINMIILRVSSVCVSTVEKMVCYQLVQSAKFWVFREEEKNGHRKRSQSYSCGDVAF